MQQQHLTSPTTETAIVYLTKNFVQYNLWANQTLTSWLKTKPREVLEKEVPSSFTTIQRTLVHIWQTQQYWLSVILKDPSPAFEPFEGSLEDAMDGIVAHSQQMADHIGSLTEEGVNEPTLVTSPWFECNFPNFEYVMQIVNHGTYHRGQIITIGRNLGFTDAPMTDYNFFNIHGK